MKKIFSFVVAAGISVAALSSCAMLATPAGAGSLYTDVAHSEAVTSNSVGSKVGTAKVTNYLGAISIGDASVQAAAKSAGIRKISHVDCKKTSILGLYATYTVYVYGE